jgi:FixJ family two-component response regulator
VSLYLVTFDTFSANRENVQRVGLKSMQRKVVAVVDDDPSMLKGLARLLDAYGFEPAAYGSAEAFLQCPATSDAACLILDIHLRGMSGIELRRRLTQAGSKLPVIFITAIDDEPTRLAADEAGCVACLRKPFAASLLMGAIAKAWA